MIMRILHLTPVRRAALLAAFALGGVPASAAWAQTGASAPPAATAAKPAPAAGPRASAAPVPRAATAVQEEDVLMFEPAPGTVYLNGGVGHEQAVKMRQDAHNWPLRMTFSQRADDEFVVGVGLKVFDQKGQPVLRLSDAGPMTYAQVPQGDYRITARFKDQTLTRSVHVGAQGADAAFHWQG